MIAWTFKAADAANVQCPLALDAGVARIIGKRFDAASGAYVADEPKTYSLDKRSASRLRAFFARAIAHGHLAPADSATAAAFGVKEPA